MGKNECQTCKYSSPLGEITIAIEGDALTGLWLEGQNQGRSPCASPTCGESEIAQKTFQWLDTYFSGKEPSFTPPLRLYGTPFQLKVWKILQTIPYGKTLTYGNIAKMLSPTMSSQAIGRAVGRNPISIIVPCHRVMGENNKLTGYQGGTHLKLELLKLEGLNVELYR